MVYVNGKWFPKEEASISVYDHGLLYGDGVFEGLRFYKKQIFLLDGHMERLEESARALMIPLPMSVEQMKKMLRHGVENSGLEDGYIRLLVTRGVGRLGLDPDSCPEAGLVAIIDSIQLYPQRYYEEGIAVVTASTRRSRPDMLESRIKSLNYLPSVLAKIEAKQAGCMEAVMLNPEGFVAECTADNIFIVRNGFLKTPDPAEGALDGLTRRYVLALADSLGIATRTSRITRWDLYTADEFFLTGSGAEIIPVTKIDGRAVGGGTPGPLTLRLIQAFKKSCSS